MGIYKRNGTFYIDFYVGGRRIREAAGTSKREAEKLLAARRADALRGVFDLPANRKSFPAFGEFMTLFLNDAKNRLKQSSFRRYAVSFKALNTFFGKYKLNEITSPLIETYRTHRSKSVSNCSVNRDIACLSAAFSFAVRTGLTTGNPCAGIRRLAEPRRAATAILSDADIERLISACRSHSLRAFIIIAINTGCRTGEILNLRWNDIDLNNGIAVLRDTKNRRDDIIFLNRATLDLLSGMPRTGEYVIGSKHGGKLGSVRKAFAAAVSRAGIPRITPHALRRAWTVRLVRAGVPSRVIQELGRWSSLALVERYSSIGSEECRAAVELLNLGTNRTHGGTEAVSAS